jgi:hypothetical protein
MFDAYARHAGERSFRDFFRLPPTKENRSQLVDLACSAYGQIGGSNQREDCWNNFTGAAAFA